MPSRLEIITQNLQQVLGGKLTSVSEQLGELIATVKLDQLPAVATTLRDRAELNFETLIDLCGVDYSDYAGDWDGARFAVVYQLLSLTNNWRVRMKVFAADDDFPVVPSVIDVWPSANWYEREAFDLFGIVFTGHPDLRRLLTDYGFIGHPFRKDFPISGNVEMRYDPDQQRVVYQPVTIEPREIVPKVRREAHYGDTE